MVVLLQRAMTKEVSALKEKMRAEMEMERMRRKREFVDVKVSSRTAVPNCTILQSSIVVLISSPQSAYPYSHHYTLCLAF
jgi:hypothetical protein